ncbi:MAG TPA: 4'-phosphopantetheinyl transferase superfamily protein [Acidimicrobiales bacterium]
MIEEVLPRAAVGSEVLGDPPEAVLLPEEEPVVAEAVEKRRREFATGRLCARRALGRLGVRPAAILPGPGGEPVWPAGVVGSITHCAGYRAAAVAWADDVPSLGIDAEPHHPLPAGVLDAVASRDEQLLLRRLIVTGPEVHWDRVLFSAKEAVYKAWYPFAGAMLDYREAEVALHRDGTVEARLLVPGPVVDGRELTGFTGRWHVGDDLVVTAASRPTWA